MWLILGPVLVAVVGVILIVVHMAREQRREDRAGRKDSGEDGLPVFMVGFTDRKQKERFDINS